MQKNKDHSMHRAIIIPENATNGDIIKALYPNAKVESGFYGINGIPMVCLGLNTKCDVYEMTFVEGWWDAPYKAESEEK